VVAKETGDSAVGMAARCRPPPSHQYTLSSYSFVPLCVWGVHGGIREAILYHQVDIGGGGMLLYVDAAPDGSLPDYSPFTQKGRGASPLPPPGSPPPPPPPRDPPACAGADGAGADGGLPHGARGRRGLRGPGAAVILPRDSDRATTP
jgi:hypothetical protein